MEVTAFKLMTQKCLQSYLYPVDHISHLVSVRSYKGTNKHGGSGTLELVVLTAELGTGTLLGGRTATVSNVCHRTITGLA